MQDRIRQARIAAGFSQAELGEKVGYTKNYINLIENGKRSPSALLVSKFAEVLSVSEDWLRTGEGDMTAPASREQELSRLVGQMLADRPESFRNTLITTLLRFEPGSPEWDLLEKIVRTCAEQMEKPPGD